MSGVRYGGMGPDRSTIVAAAETDSGMVVGLQLLGARFSIEVETARAIAKGINDVCDAITTPNGLYGLPVLEADDANAANVAAAVAAVRRRAVQ